MWSVFVYKTFWRIILLLQENILQKNGKVEEILTKEYQYKNSYQGKYCNPKNIYGPYRITIWLTDDVTLSFCFFTWWFDSRFFLLEQFETWNRWIRTRIDYHPSITSESTNQVC